MDLLAALTGTWEGSGSGVYPTIDPFRYDERIEFHSTGKPFLLYRQATWRPGDRTAPLHTETGYFRPGGPGSVEAVIAQPTGITEVLTGAVHGSTLRLSSTHVGLAPTAKEVRTVERIITINGPKMTYELWMEAVGQPHQIHLAAELARIES